MAKRAFQLGKNLLLNKDIIIRAAKTFIETFSECVDIQLCVLDLGETNNNGIYFFRSVDLEKADPMKSKE